MMGMGLLGIRNIGPMMGICNTGPENSDWFVGHLQYGEREQ